MLLFLACWQPDAYRTPPPPEVTAEELLSPEANPEPSENPTEGTAEPDPEPGENPTDGTAQTAPPGTDPATAPAEVGAQEELAAAKASFDDVLVKPYHAYTVGTPLSLVDELGRLVTTIGVPGTRVTVLSEGSLRVKVRCDGCSPVVEGYLQKERVRK